MPEAGDYLLSHVGFSRQEKPVLVLQKDDKLLDFLPVGNTFTLRFDTSERYCAGWHELTTGKSFPCPEYATTSDKYEQCAACQKRTGFNPAFYHATSVSPQQEERNAQPHILYLAHFAPGLIKVGISHAGRGRARLLEQGARSALILETFPTAHIARQYEAKIAAMPGIAETMLVGKKIATLTMPYDPAKGKEELERTRRDVEHQLGTTFEGAQLHTFDDMYFPGGIPTLTDAHNASDGTLMSGTCSGMLGSLLFCDYQGTPVFLPIKKYTGYRMTLSPKVEAMTLPARQISLF